MKTSIMCTRSQGLGSGSSDHFIADSILGFLTLIGLLLLSLPHSAQASLTYPANIAGGTKLQLMCANCHTEWDGGGYGNANRIAQLLWNGYSGETPTNDGFALYDMDMDGTPTGLKSGSPAGEYPNALSPTKPANNVRWFPAYPDKDGDGCIQLFNRLNEAGSFRPPLFIVSLGYIGGLRGFQSYGPRGWDIDDNDPLQGCNVNAYNGIGWPTTATPGTGFTNPGTTSDNLAPPQVTDLRATSLASAAIPLAWTAVGDDPAGGPDANVTAHSNDLRYTQTNLVSSKSKCGATRSGLAGTSPCNVRDPGHWRAMWNILDNDATIADWNTGGTAPLMRVYYEPIPSTVGQTQTCTSVGLSAVAGSCPTGASHVIKLIGDVAIKGTTTVGTNRVLNSNLYWVALRVSDGVTIPVAIEGVMSKEGISPVSNIVGITTGGSGAFISSFNAGTTSTGGRAPVTLAGTSASITVAGAGLTPTNAARLVLTDTTGAVIRTATITTPATTAGNTPITGTFDVSGLALNGKYTLETRTASGTDATAAWVDAVTIAAPAPTLTSVTPNSRGQGGTGLSLALTGIDFANPMTIIFSDAAITGSVAIDSGSTTTATATIETVGATVATGAVPGPSVQVVAAGLPSNSVAFTVTAAPNYTCLPELPVVGIVGVPYGPITCSAAGGVPDYVWLETGLPDGVTGVPSGINSETLTIEGVPTTAATVSGLIKVSDANEGAAENVHVIAIAKGDQNIALSCTPQSALIGDSSICTATSSSGLATTLSSLTPAVCSISGDTVSTLAAGICTIAADQTGDDNYNPAAQVTESIPVDKLSQTITLSCAPLSISTDSSSACDATAGSGLPVTLSNTTPLVCSLVDGTVTGITRGNCVIIGEQAGNDIYHPASQVTETIAVVGPDLLMSGVINTASSVIVGQTFVIASSVANQSLASAASSTAKFYLSTDAAIVNTDIALTGDLVVSALAAGADSGALATSVTVPSGVAPGSYFVGACADEPNVVNEEIENNNCLVASAKITVTSNVDLIMTTVSKTATSVGAGNRFVITSVVRNQGQTPALATAAAFYLSVDAIITPADIKLLGGLSVPILPAMTSSASASTTVTVPYSLTPRVYYVGACADIPNLRAETTLAGASLEGNNCKTAGTINVVRAVNLQMTFVSKSTTSSSPGKSFMVPNTIKNVGTTPMTVPSTIIKFYLSTDAIIGNIGDIVIGYRVSPRLMAGQSNAATTRVSVPLSVAPRAYFVGACADANRQQIETIETDNCKAAIGTITIVRNVDLTMSAVSSPDVSVIEGTEFIIDNSVKNVGTAAMLATPATTVRFYLSTDATITATDFLLEGTRTVTGLAAGATSSALTVVTVPYTVEPGNYYIGAIADGGNNLLESNETNNSNSPSTAIISVVFDPTP